MSQLQPMWTPVFYSYRGQLAGHLLNRLETCINWAPPTPVRAHDVRKLSTVYAVPLLRWLQKLQYRMGQTEMQSSTAAQFYFKEMK